MRLSSTEENDIWDRILEREGTYGLFQRLARLKTHRLYYVHWPYDDTVKAWPLHGGDYYDEHASGEPERIKEEFDFEITIRPLSVRQREIARAVSRGYKPREIAKQLGDDGSGKVRYVKWYLKQKLAKAKELGL